MSELWELEKRQIEALQRAKVEALGICDWVGRLCEAVRDNRPKWSCYAIGQLLDHRNGDRLPRCLEVVGFFIDQVRIPVEVPWSPMTRTLPLRSTKKCLSAHGGAATLWNAFHGFLSRKLSQLYPEAVVVFDFSQTADMLVDQHWETLRRELSDVAQFDCEALKGIISREAQAAMGVCNAKLISAMASSTQPAMQPESGEEGKGDGQPANGGKTSPDEANRIARRLAKRDPAFVKGGARDWAAAIRKETGKKCSPSTVQGTALWQETMRKTGRGRGKGPSPKTVAFTDDLEAVAGEGEKHEVLNRLVAEEEKKAAEAVQQSGLSQNEVAATLEKLRSGEMSPAQAKEVAKMHPASKARKE